MCIKQASQKLPIAVYEHFQYIPLLIKKRRLTRTNMCSNISFYFENDLNILYITSITLRRKPSLYVLFGPSPLLLGQWLYQGSPIRVFNFISITTHTNSCGFHAHAHAHEREPEHFFIPLSEGSLHHISFLAEMYAIDSVARIA